MPPRDPILVGIGRRERTNVQVILAEVARARGNANVALNDVDHGGPQTASPQSIKTAFIIKNTRT